MLQLYVRLLPVTVKLKLLFSGPPVLLAGSLRTTSNVAKVVVVVVEVVTV